MEAVEKQEQGLVKRKRDIEAWLRKLQKKVEIALAMRKELG